MSARWQGKRHYKTSRSRPIDPFEELGPGDIGYRIRGGRSGLDPVETYQENGRIYGLALKSLFGNAIALALGVLLFAAFLTSLVLRGEWATLGVIAVIGLSVFFLWAISSQDLEDIQKNRRDG